MSNIKRILIFGRPGSGKSTLAYQLSNILNIPLHHLDRWFYIQNWIERDYEDFLYIVENLSNQDSWIIDGNALKSLEMRYAKADVALYLSYPRAICLFRVFKRYFLQNKFDDRAPNCPEKINWKFIQYIWTFEQRIAANLATLQNKYPSVTLYKVTNDKVLREVVQKILR
jgi:adenylate kinase family enzyme